MRVIYTAEIAIDVDATNKAMALHEAGVQWAERGAQFLAVASDVTIKRIRVEGAEKAESAEEQS